MGVQLLVLSLLTPLGRTPEAWRRHGGQSSGLLYHRSDPGPPLMPLLLLLPLVSPGFIFLLLSDPESSLGVTFCPLSVSWGLPAPFNSSFSLLSSLTVYIFSEAIHEEFSI